MVRIKNVKEFKKLIYKKKGVTTYQDIAAALEVSPSTVTKLLNQRRVYDKTMTKVAMKLDVEKTAISEVAIQ